MHRAVFNGPRPGAERVLAILYAIPSGQNKVPHSDWSFEDGLVG